MVTGLFGSSIWLAASAPSGARAALGTVSALLGVLVLARLALDAARRRHSRRPQRAVRAVRSSESSWERGARGERAVAAVLDRTRLFALHDRARPGGRGNIDHLVVARGGVYVIDAKNYNRGRLQARARTLRIGDRDETNLLRGVTRQAERVRRALVAAGVDVPVVPVLCFTGSSRPTPGAPAPLGVHVLALKDLARLLRTRGPLRAASRRRDVADLLAWLFPPA